MRQRLALLVFVDYEPTVIEETRVVREVRNSIGFGRPDVFALDPDQVGRMLIGERSDGRSASRPADPTADARNP